MKKISKKNVYTNFLWRFLERCGAQGVTLLVSIILARLIDPEVYGTVALVSVFITILRVFVDSGLGTALIQKKDADDLDFSSVFYFNIFFCLILYAGIFACAPLIAIFYEMPELTDLVRVSALVIVISGVKNIQIAYVSRNMLFKHFFFSTLGGVIVSAICGIWMAYNGYGVWALVAQELVNALVDTCVLWISVKWRPKKIFSLERLKSLYSFGWKLLLVSLINNFYNQLRQLLLGKMYAAEQLAYFNKGKQFPNAFVSNISTAIDSVLLPTLSQEQDDKKRVREMTQRSIKTCVYILSPLMIGLAAVAEPFIKLILTEKWLPCVEYMRVFCIICMFQPIQAANMNAIKALGEGKILLKIDLIKRIIDIALLLSTIWLGPLAMVYSLLVSSVLGQFIMSWPNKKLLDYGYMQQLKDVFPSIGLAGVMGVLVYLIQFMKLDNLLTLLLQILFGGGIYIVGSAVLKLDNFVYLIEQAKLFLKRKK